MKSVVSVPLNLHGTAYGKALKILDLVLSLQFAGHETCPQAKEQLRFSPFHFFPYSNIEAMPGFNNQFLIDCIGHVVAKEEPKKMVTKAGQETVCMSLYLEDLERNKMKYTFFGELVGRLVQLTDKNDGQPLILVAQLFKPSVYLNEVYIQNSRYVSRVLLNPNFPEVVAFKNSLMAHDDVVSQQITQLDSQPEYSVGDELEGGTPPISSIEEEADCWILARIVSVEVGAHDWSYLSCNNCPKKVEEVKNGYQCGRCHRILTDPSVRLWNIILFFHDLQ
ncbi:hypothetical protein PIB30_072529 [Stylosanthes scabra]|uniref:Replication factor A C-terminal domain-containing protein n=1 Tax=Stylosanthes scabra TaxID=79078 RepID=A0ABU6XPD9_9FABA|nr:hypothetical protein [Stylosanthes scabra]